MGSYQSATVQRGQQLPSLVARQQRDTPPQREQRRVQDGRTGRFVERDEGCKLVEGGEESRQRPARGASSLRSHHLLQPAQQGLSPALQDGVEGGVDRFLGGTPPTSPEGEVDAVSETVVQDGVGHLPRLEQVEDLLQWEGLEQTSQDLSRAGWVSEVVPDHSKVPVLWGGRSREWERI